MSITTDENGQLVVPREVAKAAGIEPGDAVVAEPADGGLLLRRGSITEEIDADFAAGLTTHYDSDEEFQAALDAVPLPSHER